MDKRYILGGALVSLNMSGAFMTAEEKLEAARWKLRNLHEERVPSGKDRSKIKAARKQKRRAK